MSDHYKGYRLVLIIVAGALVVLWAGVLAKGLKQNRVVSSTETLFSRADIGMDLFRLRQIRNGSLEWDIQAQQAELFEGQHEIRLREMRAILNSSDGFRIAFSGSHGILDTKTYDFIIQEDEGNVSVEMNNAYTIEAPSLVWNDGERSLRSDQPVLIRGQNILIRGRRLKMQPDLQLLTVNGDVKVTVGPESISYR